MRRTMRFAAAVQFDTDRFAVASFARIGDIVDPIGPSSRVRPFEIFSKSSGLRFLSSSTWYTFCTSKLGCMGRRASSPSFVKRLTPVVFRSRATDRIDAFLAGVGDEFHHRMPLARIIDGGDIILRFVEEQVQGAFAAQHLVVVFDGIGGADLVPSSVTTSPFTVMTPAEISSSAAAGTDAAGGDELVEDVRDRRLPSVPRT